MLLDVQEDALENGEGGLNRHEDPRRHAHARDGGDVADEQRDARDAGRAAAPMRQAADAHLLDTSDLSIEEAFAAALALVEEKLNR